MERVDLRIAGMSCGHCVSSVRRALSELDGVRVEEVKVGSASVAYDPERTSVQDVVDVVNDQGYEAEAVAA